jgi:hypothetical protein
MRYCGLSTAACSKSLPSQLIRTPAPCRLHKFEPNLTAFLMPLLLGIQGC